MTTPNTPSTSTSSAPAGPPSPPVSGNRLIATVQDMPRWAIFAIVIVGGVIAWWLIKLSQSPVESSSWEQQARHLLTSRGYDPANIESALTHYLHGGTMSPQDIALIGEAIRALGTPDINNTETNNSFVDMPSASIGTLTTTVTDASGSDNWYVVSVGAGWSSSLRGIAQQFYGDSSRTGPLLTANPKIPNDYTRISPGTRVTVPRSVAA